MRSFAVAAVALSAVLTFLLCMPVGAEDADPAGTAELLTNLFQLRRSAEQSSSVVPSFRIVADVLDVDFGNGVLVLRDASGVEFIQLDLRGQKIEPGATVRLEGKGCAVKPKRFGLAILPGMVVDNDGLHAMTLESGSAFLRAGANPISVEWFNGSGDAGLKVEYEGPGLPRQQISSSVLSRVNIDPETGASNFLAGLDYRAYEGFWGQLPDFTRLNPVATGISTNFNIALRTQNERAGLVFNGFIHVPRDGVYTFYVTSDDASRLFVGQPSMGIQVLSEVPMPGAVEKWPLTPKERNSHPWVTLEGTVSFTGIRESGGRLVMRVGNDNIQADIFDGNGVTPYIPLNSRVRVSGIYQDVVTEDGSRVPGMLLVSNWKSVHLYPSSATRFTPVISDAEVTNQLLKQTESVASGIPTIMTAAEVKALTAKAAQEQLPVSIHGVVTAILDDYPHGAVIQDATKGIFISLINFGNSKPMRLGEFYQVDGVTGPGAFAPLVVARRITHIGAGQFPRPLHPTLDQLFNGNLDTQYAEIEGVVVAVHGQQIELLTENGKITLVLSDFQPEDLTAYEDALIRIRGCAFALFNAQTRELDTSSLRMLGGAIDVLQPAPLDLFAAPKKNLAELLLFDPKAALFRRLKVSAQIVYGRGDEFYLTDGTNGIRVTTRNPGPFAVGDRVEAVGFLDFGGPAAELKEAVMRKTGRGPLPAPRKLTPQQLLLARDDGLLVQVDGTLMSHWREGSDDVLELQSGFLAFKARMDIHGGSVSLPPSGSRLELTSVYAPQGDRLGGNAASGFELLLNSPADVRVLATPPWWTLKRVLILAAILAGLLCAVLVWNKELQWKVQERGRELEIEIHNRQRAEIQHAAEAERSRIARDLHDELGAGLTEVSLLAGMGASESPEAENKKDRFRVIADKARALVSGLDVIVWAIDPKRNSLQSFADYLGRYATELFSASGIVCRFKIPIECQTVTLPEAARHSLLLAVKEAFNNIIRHASATEVRLQMTHAGEQIEIVIADNGRGFDWKTVRRGGGLTNLHERLKDLDGQCQIESEAGKGTTVRFTVPLPRVRN